MPSKTKKPVKKPTAAAKKAKLNVSDDLAKKAAEIQKAEDDNFNPDEFRPKDDELGTVEHREVSVPDRAEASGWAKGKPVMIENVSEDEKLRYNLDPAKAKAMVEGACRMMQKHGFAVKKEDVIAKGVIKTSSDDSELVGAIMVAALQVYNESRVKRFTREGQMAPSAVTQPLPKESDTVKKDLFWTCGSCRRENEYNEENAFCTHCGQKMPGNWVDMLYRKEQNIGE